MRGISTDLLRGRSDGMGGEDGRMEVGTDALIAGKKSAHVVRIRIFPVFGFYVQYSLCT